MEFRNTLYIVFVCSIILGCGNSSDKEDKPPIVVTDTTPNEFQFSSKSDLEINQWIESESIVISGINTKTPISIEGGEYRIESGSFTEQNGSVTNNQTITVRTQLTEYGTSKVVNINVGGVSADFSVSAIASDTTPDDFDFEAKVDQDKNAWIESESIVIAGINAPTPVSIENGEFRIEGGEYQNGDAFIENNQTLQVRVKTADTFATIQKANVTVGDKVSEFRAVTIANVLFLGSDESYGRELRQTSLTPQSAELVTDVNIEFDSESGGTADFAGDIFHLAASTLMIDENGIWQVSNDNNNAIKKFDFEAEGIVVSGSYKASDNYLYFNAAPIENRVEREFNVFDWFGWQVWKTDGETLEVISTPSSNFIRIGIIVGDTSVGLVHTSKEWHSEKFTVYSEIHNTAKEYKLSNNSWDNYHVYADGDEFFIVDENIRSGMKAWLVTFDGITEILDIEGHYGTGEHGSSNVDRAYFVGSYNDGAVLFVNDIKNSNEDYWYFDSVEENLTKLLTISHDDIKDLGIGFDVHQLENSVLLYNQRNGLYLFDIESKTVSLKTTDAVYSIESVDDNVFVFSKNAVSLFKNGKLTSLIDSDTIESDSFELLHTLEGRNSHLKNISVTPVGSRVVFVLNGRLWMSDGSREGTLQLEDNLVLDASNIVSVK